MKYLLVCSAIALSAFASQAITYETGDIKVKNLQVQKATSEVQVSFDIDAASFKLKSNEEAALTPVLTDGTNTVEMPSVTIAGRNRYYYNLRNNENQINEGVNFFRDKSELTGNIPYSATIPYQPWMDLSELKLNVAYSGCCGENIGQMAALPVANLDMRPAEYVSEVVYVAPIAEAVKVRQEKGQAYIDFIVNKWNIDPNYRNNASELAKIDETINKVKSDKDLTITSISIEGFASPEGGYNHNAMLAKNRTESLMTYVKGLGGFPAGVKFKTSSVPEDWAGLIKYLQGSDLANKGALLDICNSSTLTPDQKDAKIKKDFPTDYAFLLKNVYPGLRHSDYVVEYTVREYANVDEIIQVLNTAPGKLSLNEIFLAAKTMKPGSPEYNNAFETAVKLYPDDETANLNAANAAINRGDFSTAEKYLKKAGNSAQAQYARGVLAASKKDYATAASLFRQVQSQVPEAAQALEQVEFIQTRPDGQVVINNYVESLPAPNM